VDPISTPSNANYSSSDGTESYVGPEQNNNNQAATIVCDGSGGYRTELNWAENTPCGIRDCVDQHEQSHARDWENRYPDGCLQGTDGDRVPLGGPGYSDFLNQSECDAYRVSESCIDEKMKTASPECQDDLENLRNDVSQKREDYCDDYSC
jgi:hypothetical protein